MSITTKSGDNGFTTTFLGTRVKKNSNVIKFSASIDEVVSFLGIVISNLGLDLVFYKKIFIEVQKDLLYFSNLDKASLITKITMMEEYINANGNDLNISTFLLPGGDKISALVHYARSLIRKLEISYIEAFGIKDKSILKYLNRLSDYFFIIALSIEKI